MLTVERFLEIAIILAGAAMIGLAAHFGLALAIRVLTRKGRLDLVARLHRRAARGLAVFLPLLGVHLALPLAFGEPLLETMRLTTRILLILSGAWLLIRFVYGFDDFIESRLGLDVPDNLDARRTITQLRVLRSVVICFIAFTALVVVLLSFEGARQIGAGLLASAGVAGLVIGLAAQRVLGNLLAGFQIAVTQPIRIDDVVVVENEWGRIEEITLSYVVVRIWDDRRMILPISYFIEKPFTNWTRSSSQILGTVFLYVDYTVPVHALRGELDRIVEASPHWDGRAKGLVVTGSREHTLELRALISARDGGEAWNLRCEVREGLVTFLQREYPGALPRFRTELVREEAAD